MIFSGVQFPKQLTDAIDSRQVVVFAGAGVSMGEPANLGSFWELACDIAKNTGESPRLLGTNGDGKEFWEALDQFLGRLPLEKGTLNARAVKSLKTGTAHTALHASIVRLFGKPEQVRIVTTNFDLLFEAACEAKWDESPKIYTAPALPLGSSFSGIVHVHGAVDDLDSIVLTDSDFGRAYLTEGWARRFLVDLFESYTVLFVGYSHDDTVLQYLARALPDKAKDKRFALVGNDESPEKWELLGIVPLTYTKPDSKDYSNLYAAAEGLADYANRRPSQWQKLIGEIARSLPGEMDVEDAATLRHALNDVSKVRFFCDKATAVEWIEWLDNEKVFDDLFDMDWPASDSTAKLFGDWLTECHVEKQTDRLFQLLAKHHLKLGVWFWWGLAHKVSQSDKVENFDRWLDLLLQTKPAAIDVHALQFLAKKAHANDMFDQVLRLFEIMGTTQLAIRDPLRKSNPSDSYQVRTELDIPSPEWNLNEVWEKNLQPRIGSKHREILATCTRLLLNRNALARTWNNASDDYDWDSYGRSAIADHEQDEYPNTIDVIIKAARAAVETMATDIPEQTRLWIWNQHFSPSHLLRRLAIHAIGFLHAYDSDQKIRLLLVKGLYKEPYLQESITLLEENYAALSPAIKEEVVEAILGYRSSSKDDPEYYSASEHFQWLRALQKVDESCPIVKKALDAITAKYNDIPERPYPALKSWTESGWSESESPWSVEDLLSKDTTEWFDELMQFKGETKFRGPTRSGLQQAITDASKKKPEWGFKLADFLKDSGGWESDFWEPLLRGLSAWPETFEDAAPLLSLIALKELQKRQPSHVADILYYAVQNKGVPYLSKILEPTNKVAKNLRNHFVPAVFEKDQHDWLTQALNTPEGRLAEYWIHALDAYSRINARELVEPYRDELTKLCDKSEAKSRYAIPPIARQITFLTAIDEEWSTHNLYPLFTDENDEIAALAWQGFLGCRGPSNFVFAILKDAFSAAIPRLDAILAGKKDRFIEFYAAAGLWHLEDPSADWIPKLLTSITEVERAVLAEKMSALLKGLEQDDLNKSWDDWLRNYWQSRIDGAPAELTPEEVIQMLNWLPTLGEKFSEGVGLAIQMPPTHLRDCFCLRSILIKGLVKDQPNAVAQLITYLLGCTHETWTFHDLDKLLAAISIQDLNPQIKDGLNEALIQFGFHPID
ncbi:DUF4020 domain-containing protein [Neptuniibacter halophilus]|uniref:DUF4020 domain-containing protein n=1 Tax=Neptuniibacter halophilus TaxID=651666 RepID=UPI002574099D|nr:DUF4020 domain-containing protein [Neptuniibacter halophilus]